MKIVALAGGVGGARLLAALAPMIDCRDLTVVVNTGDDFKWMCLHVSPDLDTVMYTLAGLANREQGWGLEGDSLACLKSLARLGGDAWFAIGDMDLATHIYRTEQLQSGTGLAAVTAHIARALGVRPTILPMTESHVPTRVHTTDGTLAFQDYFVRRKCAPQVAGFTSAGIESAAPAPGVLEALRAANAVIICPSNPFISIGPILGVPGVRSTLQRIAAARVAVTPLIAGRAVKGPTAKIMEELHLEVSALTVARMYRDVIDTFVLDCRDDDLRPSIENLGLRVMTTDTLMDEPEARERLARDLLEALS